MSPPSPPLLQHVAAVLSAAHKRGVTGSVSGHGSAASAVWFVVYTGQQPHQQQHQHEQQQPIFETAGDFAMSLSPLSRHMPSRGSSKSAAAAAAADANDGSNAPSGSEAAVEIASYINMQRCRQGMTMTILLPLLLRLLLICFCNSMLLDTSGHTDDAHWLVCHMLLVCFLVV